LTEQERSQASSVESMQSQSFPARGVNRQYRHELHTLTYVTLDAANGGIVRNLSQDGVAVQAVAALRQQQCVRVRFELRVPRLRIDASGQVSWANSTGQCGIRFTDLSEHTRQQIGEWIFSSLLDTMAREAQNPSSIFASSADVVQQEGLEESVGLTSSPGPRPVIRLEGRSSPEIDARTGIDAPIPQQDEVEGLPDELPLSRSLSGRTLAWLVDSLIVVAGLCLFILVFLSIARELPQWRLTLGAALVAATFIVAAYRMISIAFGGVSLGARLAQAASESPEKEENATNRFR
jgi:PilZ domain